MPDTKHKKQTETSTKRVAVFDGDDASPEVMIPSVDLLQAMQLPIEFERPLIGEAAQTQTGQAFPDETKAAIDACDCTWFGSTSGASTAALFYLRWGKQTYANVRPCEWYPGFKTPLVNPEGIDFTIVRENLEDLYLGLEGDIEELQALNFYSRHARANLSDLTPGKYAIKAITKKGSERVIRFAFELARKRGQQKRVTVTCKYNMLSVSDGYFREIATEIAKEYADIEFNTYIIDDFLCRMITNPQHFDVIVMPNLYGDIMSDGAAGLIGGLGLAPSGCYGTDYAYFESAHGTAPDIAGQNIINPTATLLSACMMLDYLGFESDSDKLRQAVKAVYREARFLTKDQGGDASTTEFCNAIADFL
ncbi:MAG: isocitrate/isopropylmalate family dehydrogenase [bacterium]|nr:isocitrate/isopropylmalate dehydrogenase family protein [Gammaproteobacteria bacterium]HIL94409.1 isocitrate/isopropylmalate dehydrogenase family protein [Pseudomonadales bacterium]